MTENLSQTEVDNIDSWIEQLYECKYIPEENIKTLCEKVRLMYF